MPKEQKERAEKRHRMIHNLLTREFPDCEVRYDGEVGLDHQIVYRGKTMWLETKTCNRIVRSGAIKREEHPGFLFERFKLGNLKFGKRPVYPYRDSQHYDLVEQNGWYVFVVGEGGYIISGMPARDVVLTKAENIQRVSWGVVMSWCRPDWLDKLKMQVYNRIHRQTKIGIKGPVRELHDVWFNECSQKKCPIVEHLLEKKK